jgi:thioredoxin-related protein
MRKFHRRSIPHVAILDKDGKPLYDQAGEVEESELASILERPLK